MAMIGNFRFEQRNSFRAAGFAQIVQRKTRALPGVHGRAALQVWQGKVRFAVAPIGGAQQGEEGRVLAQRQQLSVAPGPALGREVEWKNADFGDKWISHADLAWERYVGDGKIPNREMMKSTHRYGWKLVCGWLPPTELIDWAAMF